MNSHSPYMPAPNMLMVTTTARHMVIHAALLTDVFQKLMRTAAALSSAGKIIVQLYPSKEEISHHITVITGGAATYSNSIPTKPELVSNVTTTDCRRLRGLP